ncbi:hypothetical protein WMY93_018122 [Mugilogobius chulae]|uniref:phosphoglycerate mutase (2,3-diphosphoglycerate-dependent) n=1 Tax=Mugilogobius chulae TaxID=88201 RepID=A0AAW0NJ47_9GOBI
MGPDHDYYNIISKDRRYADLTEDQLPSCESLKDTIARALPFWNDVIAPQIKQGKRVLIAAHGNSLRGIVKHLEGMSDEAIMELNLPTGIPILYELDKNLKPVKPMQFLGDEETVRKAMEAWLLKGKLKSKTSEVVSLPRKMRKSSENQRSNGLLSEYFSPGNKGKDMYNPHHSSAFVQETPMKPSQIPNRFPHQPPRRSLPFQSPEHHHRHRQQHFGMSRGHTPQSLDWHHRSYSSTSWRDGESYAHKHPQQHFPRAYVPHGPVHHQGPVTPPPPLSLANHVNHTSRHIVSSERDPPEKSTDSLTKLELKDKHQGKVDASPAETVHMLEQNKPNGHPLLNGLQKDSSHRQHPDSSSSGQARHPVTDLDKRTNFPPSHSHSFTENQHHEVAASHTSHTRQTPMKRQRESGSDTDHAKKLCLKSTHLDKTLECATVMSNLTQAFLKLSALS